MTKRDRLSFALRRLRELKTEEDVTRRLVGAHHITVDVINELMSGTQYADLGGHIIEQLNEIHAQNERALDT